MARRFSDGQTSRADHGERFVPPPGRLPAAGGNLGIRWNTSELSLYAANITNQHPNLGDLGAAGFAQHADLSPDAPLLPRVATLQPFNAGIQYRQRF